MAEELTYSRGELTAEQLQEEIASFWADLQDSSKLRAEVNASGIDLLVLDHIRVPDAITVRPDSSGADPAFVLLIVAFAPAGNRILKDVWSTTILPRIRRRWGDDAIGEETRRRDQ